MSLRVVSSEEQAHQNETQSMDQNTKVQGLQNQDYKKRVENLYPFALLNFDHYMFSLNEFPFFVICFLSIKPRIV